MPAVNFGAVKSIAPALVSSIEYVASISYSSRMAEVEPRKEQRSALRSQVSLTGVPHCTWIAKATVIGRDISDSFESVDVWGVVTWLLGSSDQALLMLMLAFPGLLSSPCFASCQRSALMIRKVARLINAHCYQLPPELQV